MSIDTNVINIQHVLDEETTVGFFIQHMLSDLVYYCNTASKSHSTTGILELPILSLIYTLARARGHVRDVLSLSKNNRK